MKDDPLHEKGTRLLTRTPGSNHVPIPSSSRSVFHAYCMSLQSESWESGRKRNVHVFGVACFILLVLAASLLACLLTHDRSLYGPSSSHFVKNCTERRHRQRDSLHCCVFACVPSFMSRLQCKKQESQRPVLLHQNIGLATKSDARTSPNSAPTTRTENPS